MTVRQGYPAPIAYTYDAAEHCPGCTAERFGVDEDGWIPEDALDSEGNGIGAVAPWDEGPDRDMSCDDCGTLIREHEPDDDDEGARDACRRARAAWARTSSQLPLPLDA